MRRRLALLSHRLVQIPKIGRYSGMFNNTTTIYTHLKFKKKKKRGKAKKKKKGVEWQFKFTSTQSKLVLGKQADTDSII